MFNAQTNNYRFIISIAIFAIAATTFSSCIRSNSQSEDNARKATSLFELAQSEMTAGRYAEALQLLDSIDHSLPDAVDIRRNARLLRPQLLEQLSAQQLAEIDSLLAEGEIAGNDARSRMSFIKNDIEGFYAPKATASADVNSSAGLHARVGADFRLFIIATSPEQIGATSVNLICGERSLSTGAVQIDGERNRRSSSGAQVITLTEAESYPLAQFVAESSSEMPIIVEFRSDNGRNHRVELSTAGRQGLRDAFALVESIRNDHRLRIERERIERQLELARQQMANVADK